MRRFLSLALASILLTACAAPMQEQVQNPFAYSRQGSATLKLALALQIPQLKAEVAGRGQTPRLLGPTPRRLLF